MRAFLEELDSKALGQNLLQIKEPEILPNFTTFETTYLNDYSPFYVYVKVPAEDLKMIHYFEDHGFHFVEFQLEMTKRIPKRKYNTSAIDNFFYFPELGPNDDIEPLLKVVDNIMNIDRISIDPLIDPTLAKKRYRLYVTNSWLSPDETLLITKANDTHEIVNFLTFIKTGPTSVLHFLGGTAKNYQTVGITIYMEQMLFNYYIDHGINSVTTNISLSNYPIMESEYKFLDFKPKQSRAILRKIYTQPKLDFQ